MVRCTRFLLSPASDVLLLGIKLLFGWESKTLDVKKEKKVSLFFTVKTAR
jgi:hypothetical protein